MMSRRGGSGGHDGDLKKRITWDSLRRVINLAKPYRMVLIFAGILSLIGTFFQLLVPVLVNLAVNRVATTHNVRDVDQFAGGLAGLIVLSATIIYVQFILSAQVGNKIIKDLRLRLFSHLQRLPVAFFDRSRSGDLGSNLSNDVSQLQVTLATDLSGFVGTICTLGGGLALAVIFNWKLAAIAFTVLALMMSFFVVAGRGLRKLNRAALDALADAMGSIVESLANIRLIKAFARESYEDERAHLKLTDLILLSNRSSRIEGLMVNVGVFGSFLMLIACLWYGERGVLTGDFTAGAVGGFVTSLFIVLGPMASFASLFTRLQRTIGASERVFAILDEPAEPADAADAVDFPVGMGSVVFSGVEFSYLPDQPVLTGLSLELAEGKVTALVGPSGAGKTTVASLLYRFYEPDSGAIAVNGVRVEAIRRQALRENIGIVPQEPILFNGTISENIRYGRLDATDEEVRRAAVDANVDEFVSGFTQGYQTLIGERGVTLSGGQRQRMAIARALLKNPQILVLDEATSALDNKSEALVKEALDRLMVNRTTLVIAHRLSTVRNADKIAVVAEGRIVESGTHSELLSQRGKYAELYELVDA